MSYIALYRKFRPLSFDEVIGQENIVTILKHQIKNNQVGHAYLFCGSKGTGKTSTAKIFSRALNCLFPSEGEPCNECDICKGIISGSLVDVMEIDAASNNSVDNIRSIRDDAIYAPTLAKYKVYIIDEVHMLSSGAFNALLKTLEEPPAHVIFILATTEPHKLPATILSRCQRFEFKRISVSDITKRLEYICAQNEISFDNKALDIISRASDGALRDAISILDQIISSGIKEITLDNVKNIMGISSDEMVFSLLYSILKSDVNTSLKTLTVLFDSGKDIKYFIWQMISFLRDVLVYQTSKEVSLLHNFSSAQQVEQLLIFDSNKIISLISSLSELENNIKWATFPNIMLESAIIKLCSDYNHSSNKPKDLPEAPAMPITPPTATDNKVIKTTESKIPQKKNETTPATPDTNSFNWSDILNSLKNSGKVMLYGALVNTSAKIEDNTIKILFGPEGAFGKTVVEKPDNITALKNILLSHLGGAFEIKCFISDTKKDEISPIDKLENKLKISGVNVKIN
jgi:DNA polymerase-3 subunit gamma/tau